MSEPISPALVRALLTFFFALHHLSALLTIGLTWTAAGAAWRGSRRLERDCVAIATINISVTVVLGVAALLFVSVVYTRPFFTASLLLFPVLMAVVPMLAIAAGALYAVKWLPQLEHRLRWRTALLAVTGMMAIGMAVVFSAISALSWCRPGPGDDWVAMLVASTWFPRLGLELSLAAMAAAVGVIVRYGWVDEEQAHQRNAAVAGAVACMVAAATAFLLADRILERITEPFLVGAPWVGLFAAFLLVARHRYRGRGAALATGGLMIVLVIALAVVRERLRSGLV